MQKLKYFFCSFLLISLLASCSQEADTNSEKAENTTITSRSSDVDVEEYRALFKEKFPRVNYDNFWDDVQNNKVYKYASGVDLDGNSIISRIGDGGAESCEGVGCSNCDFNSVGGGCKCKKKEKPDGYCNHTVTKD